MLLHPAFFSLRVDGSEGVYTERPGRTGPQSSESAAWTFATFLRVREGLKFEPPLEENQRLVDPPQQPCGRISRYLCFSQSFATFSLGLVWHPCCCFTLLPFLYI
eukprot:bmy_13917T0